MAHEPGSAILTAMYQQNRDEARRLAADAPALTIWEAAALGADDRLRALLDADHALVNAAAQDGFHPLGLAAFFAPAATVTLLLSRGADAALAAGNDFQVQPLHAAVAARNADAVRALLDAGANPNARQQAGYTPLMGAASAGRDDLADLLLARGADPSVTNAEGKTAADLARSHGHAALGDRLASAP